LISFGSRSHQGSSRTRLLESSRRSLGTLPAYIRSTLRFESAGSEGIRLHLPLCALEARKRSEHPPGAMLPRHGARLLHAKLLIGHKFRSKPHSKPRPDGDHHRCARRSPKFTGFEGVRNHRRRLSRDRGVRKRRRLQLALCSMFRGLQRTVGMVGPRLHVGSAAARV
jgi:hypothetical protein